MKIGLQSTSTRYCTRPAIHLKRTGLGNYTCIFAGSCLADFFLHEVCRSLEKPKKVEIRLFDEANMLEVDSDASRALLEGLRQKLADILNISTSRLDNFKVASGKIFCIKV